MELAIYKQQIRHYLEVNKNERALKLIDESLSQNPNDGKLLIYRASALYGLGNYEEVIKTCTDNIDIGGSDEVVRLRMIAKSLRELSRTDEAEDTYLSCLKLQPNDLKSLTGYGYVLLDENRYSEAKQIISDAKEIAPESEEVYRIEFYYALKKGNIKEQTSCLEALYANSPYANNLVLSSIHEFKRGNISKAYKLAREAFENSPTDPNILWLLQGLEVEMNPWLMPHRIIRKLGGSILFFAVWVGVITTLDEYGLEGQSFVATALMFGAVAYVFFARLILGRKIK